MQKFFSADTVFYVIRKDNKLFSLSYDDSFSVLPMSFGFGLDRIRDILKMYHGVFADDIKSGGIIETSHSDKKIEISNRREYDVREIEIFDAIKEVASIELGGYKIVINGAIR